MLRKIFGSKGEEMTGEWRKLHKGLHSFQSEPNLVVRIKENYKGRTRGTYGAQNTCMQGFGGKT